VGRIDRQLAKALVFFAVEDAVSDGTDPGVDLAWGRDPLGFVNEAIAGGLDRLLDLLLRGIAVKRGKLRAQLRLLGSLTRSHVYVISESLFGFTARRLAFSS
jgi:hypothetical protein